MPRSSRRDGRTRPVESHGFQAGVVEYFRTASVTKRTLCCASIVSARRVAWTSSSNPLRASHRGSRCQREALLYPSLRFSNHW
jgi:hypothetical protein